MDSPSCKSCANFGHTDVQCPVTKAWKQKDSTKPPSVTEKTIEPVEESVSMNMMGNCNSVPEIHAEKDTEKPRTLTASSSVPKHLVYLSDLVSKQAQNVTICIYGEHRKGIYVTKNT